MAYIFLHIIRVVISIDIYDLRVCEKYHVHIPCKPFKHIYKNRLYLFLTSKAKKSLASSTTSSVASARMASLICLSWSGPTRLLLPLLCNGVVLHTWKMLNKNIVVKI